MVTETETGQSEEQLVATIHLPSWRESKAVTKQQFAHVHAHAQSDGDAELVEINEDEFVLTHTCPIEYYEDILGVELLPEHFMTF